MEEAWRIVDPALEAGTAIYEYEKGTWGPREVEQKVSPPGGWRNPTATDQEDFRVAAQAGRRGIILHRADVTGADVTGQLPICRCLEGAHMENGL